MIAADIAKEMLAPGDEPAWMKGGIGGAVEHGVMRANIMGVPQIAYDAMPGNPFSDHFSGTRTVRDAAGILGPTASLLTGWLLAPLTEEHTALGELRNTLPGAVVWNRIAR